MSAEPTQILVLGASGLIGQSLAEVLAREGFAITAVSRRFTRSQVAAFGVHAVTTPIVDLSSDALAGLLTDCRPSIIINCLGVLQDGPRGTTRNVHGAFVSRLLAAIDRQEGPILLFHVSIPGRPDQDATAFSRTKREAETLLAKSSCPFAILRPGFVIAPGAYGGSALVRSLAAMPFDLPVAVAGRPFATTAIDDLVRTISAVAHRWTAGERRWHAVWDILEEQPATVGVVVDAFRKRFGGPRPILLIPSFLLRVGAHAGDAASLLGWSPPVRTTALREMMRGVEGDPRRWTAESGVTPSSLSQTLSGLPNTIQERWFGRLFLLKSLIIASLAVFWTVSGLVALLAAFAPASAILAAHGFPSLLAQSVTLISSIADIGVGLTIAVRRTCRAGLLAGVALSLFYMASAALITPELWVEPLGALVKTGPAIVLMIVAVAILEER